MDNNLSEILTWHHDYSLISEPPLHTSVPTLNTLPLILLFTSLFSVYAYGGHGPCSICLCSSHTSVRTWWVRECYWINEIIFIDSVAQSRWLKTTGKRCQCILHLLHFSVYVLLKMVHATLLSKHIREWLLKLGDL